MFHQMHLVSTGHLTESASGISQQTMPTNKYLFIQAQAEATVYRIALTKRKIIIGITLCQTAPSRITSSHIQELYKPVTGLHIRLSVFQVTAVSMSTQKHLTFKISNLQLFKPSINNSPFPMWCWFGNCRKKIHSSPFYF